MATKKLFIVEKRGGIAPQRAAAHAQLDAWIDDSLNGKFVVQFSRLQEKRSISQNDLSWVWYQLIADAWGEATGMVFTAQQVHDVYCQMFLPIHTPKGVIGGETKKLSVEQFTEFLNRVQADAASEYGITLKSYNDEGFDAWWQLHKDAITHLHK